ncbi:MAG: hypothetical protein WBM35_04790 [Candidatus Electrothrix sp.]
MNELPVKVVGFCNQYVQIKYNNSQAESIVNFLCADLHLVPNAEQHTLARALCELELSENDHFFSLRRNREHLYQGRCQRELAYALINEVIFQCLDKNNSGLALHAAAVHVDRGGILLPGNSGAGKSTFVAWLTACGCGYLTDELVVLSGDTHRIHPFTRPLTIRSASAEALAPYVHFKKSEVLTGDSGFMVPHRQLNPVFTPMQPPLSLILFPRYKADVPPTLKELTPGMGCLRLMECYVNARNIPGHGISELAQLTKKVPMMELTYGSFTGLGALLAETLPEFFRDIFS